MAGDLKMTPQAAAHEAAVRLYGSAENYKDRKDLDAADIPAIRAYNVHTENHKTEAAILESLNSAPPSFIDPFQLRELPMHLLGIPDGSAEHARISGASGGLRGNRQPLIEGCEPPGFSWKDYTEMGWPRLHGNARRIGSPEEHAEIERRLRDGALTMPGSAVALKGQTLASAVAEKLAEPAWLIEGLLRAGGAMMVYGPTGVGKSWFVHTLMLMASHGRSIGVQEADTGTCGIL